MVKVSVIVPIFNVSKYLPRFFNSLKKQNLSNVEYILVDDGSTDNSLQLCYEFKNEMDDVKVIHQRNRGVGVARNVGLKIAKGKYVYFCDPDDTLKFNLLSENYFLAEKYKADLVIFGFDIKNCMNKTNKQIKLKYQLCNNKLEFINIFPALCHDAIINYLWNKLYRREIIKNIRFENVRTGEDIRFNILVYNLVAKVLINDKIYYQYYKERPNSSQSIKSIDDIFFYLEENKRLERLLLEKWNRKNNSRFIQVIEKKYLDTVVELLIRVESYKSYIKKIKILNKFSAYRLNKFLNFNFKKGIKYNYNILVFKMRYIPFVLSIDKCLRKIKNN